jgi:hypothetical protein
VLLFPAGCGPFTATNGPATAFRAAAAIQILLMLLGRSLIIALLQPGILAVVVDRVFTSRGGPGPAPLMLRC